MAKERPSTLESGVSVRARDDLEDIRRNGFGSRIYNVTGALLSDDAKRRLLPRDHACHPDTQKQAEARDRAFVEVVKKEVALAAAAIAPVEAARRRADKMREKAKTELEIERHSPGHSHPDNVDEEEEE